MTRRAVVALGLAVAAAGLVATTAGCAARPSTAPAAAAGGAAAAGAAAVPATLRFTGRTLDGAAFDAATLAGRPTVLWFWAPWCATCAAEAQSVADLKDEYGDRLAVLGIAGMGDNTAMHRFVADLNVGTVPHLDDGQGVVWRRFGITEQSTYVLLDRTGAVRVSGYLDDLQLTAQIKALVA
ncbi:TlpA family protein disulfide reductase [Krasilnikovia sp. MM14-A1004]|uniref:TlpA family protein disulfide reductase n=1 Tax=Krasilnikovia sp. MM14-A1004 TaxID=3373541 RepID=UPI00399D0171